MDKLHHNLIVTPNAAVNVQNSVQCGKIRCSFLTSRLLRIEVCESEQFTDAPTQSIWHRNLGAVQFTVHEKTRSLLLRTKHAVFSVHKKTGKLLFVQINGKKIKPNEKHNLKGTKRTLDMTFGAVPLDDGVLSSDGVAILNDSTSLILDGNGMVQKRPTKESDIYVFAYGTEYLTALKDFYTMTGPIPLIPRFVLGNWWSRYHAYSEEEYKNLMLDFKAHDIPLTVATIDMDWHWVNLKEKFGADAVNHQKGGSSGWTGYSWNTDLFPHHQEFLNFLHQENLKVTMNLHPADGIRPFEDCYEETAKAMGMHAKEEKPIPFDIADAKFINAYLDCAHHPLEEEGVDFWWIDWQQGTKSKLEGLDPLWSLNHYHYLDSARNHKRPLILSRYAGIGSHRYPLGFSGDTAMSWKVLDFQPYFTSTASNCGYTWWSHDIGGHHMGIHDDELYTRWIEFGVFSPILRLHSTSSDLLGKEPWNYDYTAQNVTTEFLRLRHKMIPYLYTMAYRAHKDSRALCEPLYYEHPKEKEAYLCKNGYCFGSELLVCPVTTPMYKKAKTACTKVYLPKGRWTNIFTKRQYLGQQTAHIHSGIAQMPVFLKEGGIVPLSLDKGNSVQNPQNIALLLSHGTNQFTLYEDNGETLEFEHGSYSKTEIHMQETSNELQIRIEGANALPFMPNNRTFTLCFLDVQNAKEITVQANSEILTPQTMHLDGLWIIKLSKVPIDSTVKIRLTDMEFRKNPDFHEEIMRIFAKYNGDNLKKSALYLPFKKAKSKKEALALAKGLACKALRQELLEVLSEMM